MIENNKPQLVKKRIDNKRPGYRGEGGYQGGATNQGGAGNPGGNTGGGPPGGGDKDMFSSPSPSTNREKGIMSRGKGPKGTTGDIRDFTDTGPDRSAVSQFSTYGKNLFNQNLKGPSLLSKITSAVNPKNIFSGLLGLVNPALGLFAKGFNFLSDKAQDLRGYNPDGSPRTQAEYEAARRDRQIQSRIDKMMGRMLEGKTFSQKNLDSLLGMKDMFGNPFSTNLGNIDNVRGSNLRGILNSGVPVGVAPMDVNVPTGIINTMAIDRLQPSYSFGIPDPTGEINTDQFTSSDGLGIYDG